jgi:hypothetical protein
MKTVEPWPAGTWITQDSYRRREEDLQVDRVVGTMVGRPLPPEPKADSPVVGCMTPVALESPRVIAATEEGVAGPLVPHYPQRQCQTAPW